MHKYLIPLSTCPPMFYLLPSHCLGALCTKQGYASVETEGSGNEKAYGFCLQPGFTHFSIPKHRSHGKARVSNIWEKYLLVKASLHLTASTAIALK